MTALWPSSRGGAAGPEELLGLADEVALGFDEVHLVEVVDEEAGGDAADAGAAVARHELARSLALFPERIAEDGIEKLAVLLGVERGDVPVPAQHAVVRGGHGVPVVDALLVPEFLAVWSLGARLHSLPERDVRPDGLAGVVHTLENRWHGRVVVAGEGDAPQKVPSGIHNRGKCEQTQFFRHRRRFGDSSASSDRPTRRSQSEMRWGDSRGGSAWGRPLALPMWRRNIVQLCVACLLTVLLGGSLQLNKLAVLDGAGRQFSQSSYGSKTGFLVPFAVFKAICSLIVGSLADRHGRKRIAVLGWIVGLVAPLMVLSAPTDERGWTTVSSAAFLGMQQGLVWTCMILVTLDLCGPTARGFASGLSETVGYTAIAVFAQIYGGFERRDVSCAWSPAASADASTSPEDLARAAAPRASPRSAARRRVATPRTIGTPRASARVSARDTPSAVPRATPGPPAWARHRHPSPRSANRCGTPISARARETVASP